VKTFLVGYGLLEFVGVIMRPIMRPLFKTPGRSAIDAVASFVGSYSLGLVITNRVFREGKYTNREASVIATGFSTVSATFMIIVARTLGLMEMWNLYFWSTLVITFIVTAITVRIWPLSKKSLQELAGMYASLLHVSRLIAIKATLPLIIAVIR
jgi:nucleoside recognition membrane protein YjiH